MMFSGFGGFESWRSARESHEEFMARMWKQTSVSSDAVFINALRNRIGAGGDPSLTRAEWERLLTIAERGA